MRSSRASVQKALLVALSTVFVLALIAGSLRNPDFWQSSDRRGDHLLAKQEFAEASKAYADPWRIGVAQYRNGDFEDAAKTFARVPGADGAFNQGNAWLMHGAYDAAVASYDRALGFHPQWEDAEENKALAIARKALIDDAGQDRDKEATDAYTPDEIVFDQKGEDRTADQKTLNGPTMSDEELRATWLRRVHTTPGDFLRAKFAYQVATVSQKDAKNTKENP